jgi:hypothetical protein
MGEAGRERVEALFDVEKTVPVLEALLRPEGEPPAQVRIPAIMNSESGRS